MDRRTFIRTTATSAGALLLTGDIVRGAGLRPGMPSVPQTDGNPDARRDQIEMRRPEYQYDHSYLAPLGLLKKLPARSGFSRGYLASRAQKLLPVGDNAAANSRLYRLKELKDFENYYPVLEKPKSIPIWMSDDIFAEQRLSGANPMVIRRVSDSAGLIGSISGGNVSWEQAVAEGRLFVCDYREMPAVNGGVWRGRRKYLPRPVAYFLFTKIAPPDRSLLMPVAIRIADGGPMLTPETATPDAWQYAKICVQIADANYHETVSHLGRTHFVMEPFAISAERQLADIHPLKVLLESHFRAMLANNDSVRTTLAAPKGFVDQTLAGSLEESLSIVKWACKTYSVAGNALKKDLADRGVDDIEALPEFPYRDDALLLNAEIHRFVESYVALYYKGEADVVADFELQKWIAEVASPLGGGIAGIKAPIAKMADLTNLITHIIFTCSAGHAAVNYTQWDWMSFVPNMPLAAYRPIAADGKDQDLMEFLPPADAAREQVNMAAIRTKYQYDQFGHYPAGTFADPAAADLAKGFSERLALVEQRINDRNKRRMVSYEFLRPSLIPNSISI